MRTLAISNRPVADLRPRPTNPRTHSRKQLEQLAGAITRFGFTNPVLIDDEDGIIAGHGRVEAAKLVGLAEVPTIRIANMTEAEVRAYVIADNRLAANAGWDKDLLKLEFQYLSELDVDFDLGVTGFDLPEIDALLSAEPQAKTDPDDKFAMPEGPAITRPGDLWEIGPHRLICGDATEPEVHARLLGDQLAAMVFADPPYNVPIAGHVSGLGKVKHREFAAASGEMSPAEFTAFLTRVFENLVGVSVDGSIHFQCMDWRHMAEMLAAGEAAYAELKNLCVWAKTNGGMGSLYRSAHELVFVWKSGTAPHVNNVELGRHGRYRTNIWTYPGANSFSATRDEDLAMHPTVKPVALVTDAILDCSKRGDIVLDPFAGSGTTLLAARRTKRRGFGVELDPLYCDLIVRRLQKACKVDAVLAGNGRIFEEVEAERSQALAEEEEAA